MDAPTLVAVNRVRAGRAEEFERWLREVVAPASRSAGDPEGGWRVLRSADDAVFLFLFFGGSAEDWQLLPILEQAYGPERAAAELAAAAELLEGDQDFRAYTEVHL